MKIWFGYGSEHSMNLVMIGTFDSVEDAREAKETIERIIEQVQAQVQSGRIKVGEDAGHFNEEMYQYLMKEKIYSIATSELEQFTYEVNIKLERNKIILTSDEIEVMAFLKVLLDNGARVEMYSAHHHPGTGHGRGG